ncbi:nucleotidyl transferase AbiEii/AbiGii toxin family protein [Paenibacillus alginolyticus]|uniref:nucleotidyl transferase AbiEii/AbiGii toxin family protein n=3 Tax=Paenibacillus alginolyticus TaxID=59839 RepID=UPI001378892A|nr:nucleotidyl transferase AbiEii/AbiGii toxin family protein [Paenibacillus alginolyticus]
MFYDDEFLSRFVLKGGNALNIVYNVNNRASMDIDVSMENDFTAEELVDIESRLLASFNRVFNGRGYHVFDFKLQAKPKNIESEYEKFWGGYKVELKIIEKEKYEQLEHDTENMRRHAAVVGTGQEKKLTVDISKYEYVAPKQLATLDDSNEEYSVYVYTPVMVVYEKLRAICQQTEEYGEIVPTHRRPRARDFFDIYSIVEKWRSPVNVYALDSIHIIREIFAAKRVPLSFLLSIESYREFHRDNFNAVRDTVSVQVESYDYYFDYVVEMAERLWALINTPDLQIAEIAATAE